MKLGEFFVELLVDSAGGELTVGNLISKFGDLEAVTVGEIGALAGLAVKFAELVDQGMEAAAAIERFHAQTGLSTEELEKWQIVADQAHVSAESVATSITALQKNLAQIRMGGGNIAPFQILGIGANQDAFGVLAQLRERLRGLDAATATNLISQMGLSPEMVQVLRLSNEEFAKFARTAHGLSGPQAKAFLDLKTALTQLHLVLRDMTMTLASAAAPTIMRIVQDITALAEGTHRVFTEMTGLKFVLLAVAAYFFPITAAILGLLLVFDDLAVYAQGGNSVFGLMVEKVDALAEKFLGVANAVERMGKAAKDIATLGGAGDLLRNPLGALSIGSLAPAVAGAGVASKVAASLTQHIYSQAPAEDVARSAVAEHKRQINQAALQTNN